MLAATGMFYREHPAPGVAEHTGAGVYYGAATTEAPAFSGRRVLVVGGGNSAGQGAHVSGALRERGADRGAPRQLARHHVAVPHRSDREDAEHSAAASDGNRASRGRGSRGTGRAHVARRWIVPGGGSRRAVRVHRHPSAERLAASRRAARRQGIRPHRPGPDGGRSVRAHLEGTRANRCRSRPACPGCSPPATSAPAR